MTSTARKESTSKGVIVNKNPHLQFVLVGEDKRWLEKLHKTSLLHYALHQVGIKEKNCFEVTVF